MKRKVNYLITIFIFFICFINNVNALEGNTVDLTKKGSINITLKEKEEGVMINDAEITIYHVADAGIKDNNLVFNKRNELSCDIDYSDLTNLNLVNETLKCINEDTVSYADITINGRVEFNNLKQGLYLVKETKGVEGFSNIDSFLVTIPKIENNKWVYDINALPKTQVYKVIDLVVEKKWNTINKNIPEYVTVELYKEDTLVDTIKLSEENNWTYTFENIEKSDKYTVKEINVPKGFTPSYKVNEYTFTITNSDVLANTGQIFYPIIITFIVGFILVIFGIKTIKEA